MKHRIDPKIDCVFNVLLGSEENRNLLAHFLRGIGLGFDCADNRSGNPQSLQRNEFLDDKLSVVDVKAKNRMVYQSTQYTMKKKEAHPSLARP